MSIFEKFPDARCWQGVATAGIAWGAMVADQLKASFYLCASKT